MRCPLFFLLSLLLTGCLKTTEQLSPGQLPLDRRARPYVICFISPQDTVLAAQVGMSEPRILTAADSSLIVKTANVTLSDGQRSITLAYDSTLGYYRAHPAKQLIIQAGQTYRLVVTMTENQRVTAQVTVPALIPISRVRLDSTIAPGPDGTLRTRYTASIFWDSPGGTNYYRGWGELTQLLADAGGRPTATRLSQADFAVERETAVAPGARSLSATFPVVTAPGGQVRRLRTRLGLFTTDINYYRYQTSLQELINSPNSAFGQSSVLYSNIEGGYGVFAAYNASVVDL